MQETFYKGQLFHVFFFFLKLHINRLQKYENFIEAIKSDPSRWFGSFQQMSKCKQ